MWWCLQFFPKLHRSLYFYTSICFFSSSILLYYHCKLRQLCSSLLRFLYSLCKWLSRKNLLDQSIKYPPLNTANFSLTWPYKVITKWYYMIFLCSTFQQNSTFPDCSYLKVWFFWRGWTFYSFLTGHFSLLSEGLYCHWSFSHWIVSFLLIHALNIKESVWSYYVLNLVGIEIYIQEIEVKLFSISTINWKSYLLNTAFIPLLIWSNIIWICQFLSHVLTSITLLRFFS